MNGVRAIRWLSFRQVGNTGPSHLNVDTLTEEQCLAWEMNPDREVSVEVIPSKSNASYCSAYGAIGIEVDTRSTELVRVYPEDGNTVPDEEGHLRSLDVEVEESVWGVEVDSGWENALRLYQSVEQRETWSEGVVRKPQYKKVVVKQNDDYLDEELVAKVAEFFGRLPIKTIRRRKSSWWEHE